MTESALGLLLVKKRNTKSSNYVAKLQSYSHRRQEDQCKRATQTDMSIMQKRCSCKGKQYYKLISTPA